MTASSTVLAQTCQPDNTIGPSPQTTNTAIITLPFTNAFSGTVAIMYVFPNCSELKQGDIAPGTTQNVATTDGAVFVARKYLPPNQTIGPAVSVFQASAATKNGWIIAQTSGSSFPLIPVILAAVGAVVLIAIVVVVIFVCMRRNKQKKANSAYTPAVESGESSWAKSKVTADPRTPSPARNFSSDNNNNSLSRRPNNNSPAGFNNQGPSASSYAPAPLPTGFNSNSNSRPGPNNNNFAPNNAAPTTIVAPNMKKTNVNQSKAAKRASLKWWEAPGHGQNAAQGGVAPGAGQAGGAKGGNGTLGRTGTVNSNSGGTMNPSSSGFNASNVPNTGSMSRKNPFGTLAGAGAGSQNKFDYYDATPQQNNQQYEEDLPPAPANLGPGSRLKVIHPAQAQLEDELTLMPGDVVVLTEAYGDGWCLAKVVKSQGYRSGDANASRIGDEGMIPVAYLDVMETARMSIMVPQGSQYQPPSSVGFGNYDGDGVSKPKKRVQSMLRPESVAMFAAAGRNVDQMRNDYGAYNGYTQTYGQPSGGYNNNNNNQGNGQQQQYGQQQGYNNNNNNYGNKNGW